LFVKATVLKQQISNFYSQVLSIEAYAIFAVLLRKFVNNGLRHHFGFSDIQNSNDQ